MRVLRGFVLSECVLLEKAWDNVDYGWDAGIQGGIYRRKHMESMLERDKGSLGDSTFLYAKAYGEMCRTNRIFSTEFKVLGFGKQD